MKTILIGILALLMSPLVLSAADKPNIVYILADDAGIGDIACYGGKKIQTPNIDRLAKEGLRFTNAYSGSAVCAPTRDVLMTGRHNGHALIRANKRGLALASETVTVAEILKKQSYATGGFGKWGLGLAASSGAAEKQGFDLFFGYYDQVHAHDYFTGHLVRNGKDESQKKGSYSHDVIEKEALKFIDEHKAGPFFLYAPFTLPHGKYEMPAEAAEMKLYDSKPWSQKQKTYAAMVTRLDTSVGRIVDKLKELGIADNTLVIFSSDNGATFNDKVLESAGGLRGIKRSLYEGGIRTPQVAWWPGKIQPGTTSDFLTSHVDFLATASEIAGAMAPKKGDGISILPTLLGKEQTPHDFLFWEIYEGGFQQAVRFEKWKGHRTGTKDVVELYDLSKDRAESKNVAAGHPEIVAQMTEIMNRESIPSPHWNAPEHGKKKGAGKKTKAAKPEKRKTK